MEDASSFEIIEKNFLNKKTIELLHWMVYWRYAPYYNVVSKLFLSNEVEKLLDKKQAPKKNKISHKFKSMLKQTYYKIYNFHQTDKL